MIQRRLIINKTIYGLVTCTCFALFVYFSTFCFQKYVKENTTTYQTILSTQKAPFPQLTICPDYGIAYKTGILKSFNLTPSDIRNYNYPKVENMTSYEFHNLVTYEIDEVLYEMEIEVARPLLTKSETYKIKYTFDNISESDTKVMFDTNDWHEQRYNTFGRCYSYTTPILIQKSEVSSSKARKSHSKTNF